MLDNEKGKKANKCIRDILFEYEDLGEQEGVCHIDFFLFFIGQTRD